MLALRVKYCLQRKELVIQFPSSEAAITYQRINPEGRILYSENPRDIYLPIWDTMISFRSTTHSASSFVVKFKSEDAARKWSDQVKIATLGAVHTEVYIKSEVDLVKYHIELAVLFYTETYIEPLCSCVTNSYIADHLGFQTSSPAATATPKRFQVTLKDLREELVKIENTAGGDQVIEEISGSKFQY